MTRTLTAMMLLGLMSRLAYAGEDQKQHLDLYGTTRFPYTAGMGLRYETPIRLQVSLAGGMIPDAYSSALGSVMVGLAGGEEIVGTALDVMLAETNYFHLGAGWRPFRNGGLVLAGGLQRLNLGGSAADIEIEDVDLSGISQLEQTAIRSSLTMFTADLRYDLVIGERILLSMSAGWMQTLSASTNISVAEEVDTEDVREITGNAETIINALYEGYFRSPTVGISVGYRFF